MVATHEIAREKLRHGASLDDLDEQEHECFCMYAEDEEKAAAMAAASGDCIFIAVPKDIAAKIQREGYRCSRRRQIPAHRNQYGAIHAYRRTQRCRPPALLKVRVPHGVAITKHKDGVKLGTDYLPPEQIEEVMAEK